MYSQLRSSVVRRCCCTTDLESSFWHWHTRQGIAMGPSCAESAAVTPRPKLTQARPSTSSTAGALSRIFLIGRGGELSSS